MTAFGTAVMCVLFFVACRANETESIGLVGVSQTDILTIADVRAKGDDLLGQTVRVRGQVHIQQHFSRRPCNPVTGEGCDPLTGTVIQLVTPGQPPLTEHAVELNRAKEGGEGFEPFDCKRAASGIVECGGFTSGTVTVVAGVLRKQRVVTGQIVHPDGSSTPTQHRDVFILVLPR